MSASRITALISFLLMLQVPIASGDATPFTSRIGGFWSETNLLSSALEEQKRSLPSAIREERHVAVDVPRLRTELAQYREALRSTGVEISLPSPIAGEQVFLIKPASIMSAELAAKFPNLHAYEGSAVGNPSTTIRLEVTEHGLTAQILDSGGRWIIDPVKVGDSRLAKVLFKDAATGEKHSGVCLVGGTVQNDAEGVAQGSEALLPSKKSLTSTVAYKDSGLSLRTYRIAVAVTGEYGEYFGGTKEAALSAVVTTMNRVNGIFERELSITFELVANNDLIIFTNRASDPFFGNDNPNRLIQESQTEIDQRIGSANYDIGHTFSTGAGGLAGLGVVCEQGFKASGVTGADQPEGDFFDVDFVAHEIGHQLGAEHTFNGALGSCSGGNRSASSAFEPGSGSTIMSYAGLCGSDNLQNAVDPIFHSRSFDQMFSYVSEGGGASCAVLSSRDDQPPSVDAGDDFSVPKGTPIVVTGTANDDSDGQLTFLWEQRDLGPQARLNADDDGSIPLFRVRAPSASPERYLPSLATVVSGALDRTEKLPIVGRDMSLRLTARDGLGGVGADEITVSVIDTAGPFTLLAPNGGESVGESRTVTWDVSGTRAAPISASFVDIYLSTDGGATFPRFITRAFNDGSAPVSFPPGIKSSSARLMIKAKDNIFYDVSDANFTIDSDQLVTPNPVVTSLSGGDKRAIISFSTGTSSSVVSDNFLGECSAAPEVDIYRETTVSNLDLTDFNTVTSDVVFDQTVIVEEGGIEVEINAQHTFRGDLLVELTSPSGTVVTLKEVDNTDGVDNLNVIYPITAEPANALSPFYGEDGKGAWQLKVTDSLPGDQGVLESWAIKLTKTTPGLGGSAYSETSPVIVTGLTNGEEYSCQLTAFSSGVASESVYAGMVVPSAGAGTDVDNDGVIDVADNCPNTANTDQLDTDSDGEGDVCDVDDDNDGVSDDLDAFPLDSNETTDSDADGVGNNADHDDDNDGFSDREEVDAGSDPVDPNDVPIHRRLNLPLIKALLDSYGF